MKKAIVLMLCVLCAFYLFANYDVDIYGDGYLLYSKEYDNDGSSRRTIYGENGFDSLTIYSDGVLFVDIYNNDGSYRAECEFYPDSWYADIYTSDGKNVFYRSYSGTERINLVPAYFERYNAMPDYWEDYLYNEEYDEIYSIDSDGYSNLYIYDLDGTPVFAKEGTEDEYEVYVSNAEGEEILSFSNDGYYVIHWFDSDGNLVYCNWTNPEYWEEYCFDSYGEQAYCSDSDSERLNTFVSADISQYVGKYNIQFDSYVKTISQIMKEEDMDFEEAFSISLLDNKNAYVVFDGDSEYLTYSFDNYGRLVLRDKSNTILKLLAEDNYIIISEMGMDIFLEHDGKGNYRFTDNAMIKTFNSMMEVMGISTENLFTVELDGNSIIKLVFMDEEMSSPCEISKEGFIYVDSEWFGKFIDSNTLEIDADGISMIFVKE